MSITCVLDKEEKYIRKKRINRCFDLDKLPTTGLKNEFREYIYYRGEVLAVGSIRAEFWPYNVLCKFLDERYPKLESILDVELETITRKLKVWMMKNEFSLTKKRKSPQYKNQKVVNNDVILYLRRLYTYFIPEEDIPEIQKNIWDVDKLDFPLKKNPIHTVKSINFTKISQREIREETKRACAMHLTYLAVDTVLQQIRSMKRFSEFLERKYPEIESLKSIDREILEEYLVYLNTEVQGKKSFRSELKSMKSLLDTIGKIEEYSVLCHLFLIDDIHKGGDLPQYRSYSDEELMRLNAAIVEMDEQVARALILHQMLGTRIVETLTLKQDCLIKRAGHWHIRAYQFKTNKPIYKPVNEDVIKLIEKSIEYTNERYGKQDHIFVVQRWRWHISCRCF